MSECIIEYDEAPIRPFHFHIAVASTGGVFADGFGIGIIGIALTMAAPQLALDSVWIGLLGGASLAGLFAGALLTGPLADHFGRRPFFASNMIIAGALSALQFLVSSGLELLLLRVAIGFLLGTDYVVSKALLTEFTPCRVRGRVLGVLSIAWAGGYGSAYAVGFALTSAGPQAWRWMLLVSAAPCLLIAPLRWSIPESVVWLLHHGQVAKASRIVRSRVGAQVALPRPPPAVAAARGRWQQLLAPQWRIRTFVGCTFFTCQVIPYFAIGTFVAQVLSALHLRAGYAGGLIYNSALIAGAIAGLAVVDRIGRRVFLVGSFAISAASMLVLCLWPNLPASGVILLFAIFAGVLSAASNLVYVYLPELFPTNLRASGIGLAIAASRTGSAVSTFLLPIVVDAYGVRTALAACVAVLGLGALICFGYAPETRNLRLGALDAIAC